MPGDEGVGQSQFPETNSARTELYRAVAELRETPEDGKWYFCEVSGFKTLRFFLRGHHIVIGGIFNDIEGAVHQDTFGNPLDGELRILMSQILHSQDIQEELSTLLNRLGESGITHRIVYEYDPINGGTSFVPSENQKLFFD